MKYVNPKLTKHALCYPAQNQCQNVQICRPIIFIPAQWTFSTLEALRRLVTSWKGTIGSCHTILWDLCTETRNPISRTCCNLSQTVTLNRWSRRGLDNLTTNYSLQNGKLILHVALRSMRATDATGRAEATCFKTDLSSAQLSQISDFGQGEIKMKTHQANKTVGSQSWFLVLENIFMVWTALQRTVCFVIFVIQNVVMVPCRPIHFLNCLPNGWCPKYEGLFSVKESGITSMSPAKNRRCSDSNYRKVNGLETLHWVLRFTGAHSQKRCVERQRLMKYKRLLFQQKQPAVWCEAEVRPFNRPNFYANTNVVSGFTQLTRDVWGPSTIPGNRFPGSCRATQIIDICIDEPIRAISSSFYSAEVQWLEGVTQPSLSNMKSIWTTEGPRIVKLSQSVAGLAVFRTVHRPKNNLCPCVPFLEQVFFDGQPHHIYPRTGILHSKSIISCIWQILTVSHWFFHNRCLNVFPSIAAHCSSARVSTCSCWEWWAQKQIPARENLHDRYPSSIEENFLWRRNLLGTALSGCDRGIVEKNLVGIAIGNLSPSLEPRVFIFVLLDCGKIFSQWEKTL